MKIIKESKNFEQMNAELLIVGVRKNSNQIKNWESFVSFFGDSIEGWLKSGDIQTDQKN